MRRYSLRDSYFFIRRALAFRPRRQLARRLGALTASGSSQMTESKFGPHQI